mmetsp:Transcript_2342/g.5305  ORF Transcript_2342/g.5305 Transcript_2342/m.5305 type:complete len:142 (-) Transcript_2342:2281-2706(-)
MMIHHHLFYFQLFPLAGRSRNFGHGTQNTEDLSEYKMAGEYLKTTINRTSNQDHLKRIIHFPLHPANYSSIPSRSMSDRSPRSSRPRSSRSGASSSSTGTSGSSSKSRDSTFKLDWMNFIMRLLCASGSVNGNPPLSMAIS